MSTTCRLAPLADHNQRASEQADFKVVHPNSQDLGPIPIEVLVNDPFHAVPK